MKSILITGISGFIGQALSNTLSKNFEVTGISKSKENVRERVFKIDLSDTFELKTFFESHNFDVIIHLATKVAKVGNNKDVELYQENINIHTSIASALQSYNCHFINFSSSSVYPNITGVYDENSSIDPSENSDCLYGLSKFNSEIIFKCMLPPTIKQLHLRVGVVHGLGMDDSRIHRVFAKELKETNSISVFGNGERTMPQIQIDSLCNKIVQLMELEATGTYNLADENISLKEIAERIILGEGNQESKIILIEQGNSHQFGMDLSKINSLLNA